MEQKIQIGLQLFTLRDLMDVDFEGTLREVAKIGYDGVEFYNYGGLSAQELKALLQEIGLKAIGTHIQLSELKGNLSKEIEYLHTIGAKYAICPWLPEDVRDADSWLEHIEALAIAGEVCKREGIELLYHNHEFEFETKMDGKAVLDVLFERLPDDIIKPELDLGWVQYSGIDPIAYIQKYAHKLPIVHIKDYLAVSRSPELKIDTVELGEGSLPLHDIISTVSKTNVEWMIVEQDNCTNPPLEAVSSSYAWLVSNYINKGEN